MNERLCVECENPLFRGEGVRCLSCWRSDVQDFQELLALGRIVTGVALPTMRAVYR